MNNKKYVSLEGAASFNDIVNRMQGELEKGIYSAANWLVGVGYDEAVLAEKTHPQSFILNEISTDVPVVIIDKSGKSGCGNTAAVQSAQSGSWTSSHSMGYISGESFESFKKCIK